MNSKSAAVLHAFRRSDFWTRVGIASLIVMCVETLYVDVLHVRLFACWASL